MITMSTFILGSLALGSTVALLYTYKQKNRLVRRLEIAKTHRDDIQLRLKRFEDERKAIRTAMYEFFTHIPAPDFKSVLNNNKSAIAYEPEFYNMFGYAIFHSFNRKKSYSTKGAMISLGQHLNSDTRGLLLGSDVSADELLCMFANIYCFGLDFDDEVKKRFGKSSPVGV